MQVWKPVEVDFNKIGKSTISLYDIAYGRYPILLVKNFYDVDSCKTITSKINDISTFDYGTGIVKKVGVFLTAYVNNKDEYFSEAEKTDKRFQILFGNEDLRNRICEFIGNLMQTKNVKVAQDNGRKYSAGIIRIHETNDYAPIHRDNAMSDAAGFSVANFQYQLSCILYLQQSESGGELVIYNKFWKPTDERFRKIGFGYSKEVIPDHTQSIVVKAETGDLAIINPKYFHEILPVSGKTSRITLGMFMAFNDGTDVVVWS